MNPSANMGYTYCLTVTVTLVGVNGVAIPIAAHACADCADSTPASTAVTAKHSVTPRVKPVVIVAVSAFTPLTDFESFPDNP